MKHSITAILLTLLVSLSSYAQDKVALTDTSASRSYGNTITVLNKAPYDIFYAVKGRVGGLYHKVLKNASGIYRTNLGDSYARISLLTCLKSNPDGSCLSRGQWDSPDYYNAELIKTIQVTSLYKFKVTCLDGTATSCLLN
jgi:hypothetical protein